LLVVGVAAVAADETVGAVGEVGAVVAGTAVGCNPGRGAGRGVASGGVAEAQPETAMAVTSASHQGVERWKEGAESG
jgi:hypothetical protein